jgi:hypothetical protein
MVKCHFGGIERAALPPAQRCLEPWISSQPDYPRRWEWLVASLIGKKRITEYEQI